MELFQIEKFLCGESVGKPNGYERGREAISVGVHDPNYEGSIPSSASKK